MSNNFELEGAYLIASPAIPNDELKGLWFIFISVDNMVYGVIVNKPHAQDEQVCEYLAYPKLLQICRSAWSPLDQDRVIGWSRVKSGVYITDRLANLTEPFLQDCLVVRGQCRWSLTSLKQQLLDKDWWLIGSRLPVPNHLPAGERIQYVVEHAGFDLSNML